MVQLDSWISSRDRTLDDKADTSILFGLCDTKLKGMCGTGGTLWYVV